MPELTELTAAQAAAEVRARRLSPVELVEALLARIDALEPTLHAWATVDREGALRVARERADEAARGALRGPLHGVPLGVKDIFFTAGLRTSAASPLYAEFVPAYDATVVARLRAAGAIVLGKTVTTQFAVSDPPPTRNPWNVARTPGGSSSGSGAAVAARMVPAALGSQTAGSVLRPAAYNGVVGLKPTYGRVSRHGVFPVAWTLDTMGVLARSVEDCALLLGAMAGHDPQDPTTSRRPVPDYARAVAQAGAPPRIGVVGGFFHQRADAETREHTAQVVQRLRRAGAPVEEVELPESFSLVHPAHAVIMAAEAAAYHQQQFQRHPETYGPRLAATLQRGMLYTAVEYLQAQRHRRRFRRELDALFDGVDLLLTPSTPAPAPADLSTTGDPAFQTPWTFAGVPAVTLPCGVGRSGLPLGVQLAAPAFQEERLLAGARWCERVLGWEARPPLPA